MLFSLRKYVLLLLTLSCCKQLTAQQTKEFTHIDTALFQDNAHHWYDIVEKTAVIHPSFNQPKYQSTQLQEIANNVLLYQKENGGWPKNYDISAILTPQQKDTLLQNKQSVYTTFDNRTTYSHIALLSKVYYVIKDEQYKKAALKGIEFILTAQYANGGWPQFYPLQKNYSRYITFNDDAMAGIMFLLKDIIDQKLEYNFIDNALRTRIKHAFNKGIDCILKMQINDGGKPTVWCQQHNEITLEPIWARKFEPPSITNGESCKIILLLMSIQSPSPEVIQAIENAIVWLNESKIYNTRVKTVDATPTQFAYHFSNKDKVVLIDSTAPPIWTRYYELKTHRPIFCNRDSKIVYTLAEVERERRTGYGWYTYEPQKILNEYVKWKIKWNKQ
ncbi:MAG TPA: pectate lyase [Chitinophagaceae bacterium]|nr:pectate lyase [Chitinophagaceae bacterium]